MIQFSSLLLRPMLKAATGLWCQLKVLGQFEGELSLSRQFLFLTSIDLRSGASGASDQGAYGCALAAAEQGPKDCTNGGSAANIFTGSAVHTQSARSRALGFALRLQQVSLSIHPDRPQIKVGVFAVIGRNGYECCP